MSTIDALMLDAGFSALPLLEACLEQGVAIGVCSGKPGDPGHVRATRSIVEDYSDKEAILGIVRKENIKAILPGVTDVSYETGAWVAESLGMPGFDSVETTTILLKKDAFRAYAQRKGLPIPKAVRDIESVGQLSYPILVKPVDAYSGLGISQVQREQDILPAYQSAASASVSGQVVIEEFKQGSLHSHSAFIRNGEIVCEFFVDEYCTVYPYQVNSSCVAHQMSEALKNAVSDCINSIVADLKLCDGLLHTQFIVNGDDFWLIELTRRCPGDLYCQLIRYSTDIPYAEYFVAPFLSLPSTFANKRPAARHYVARHTVSVAEKTIFNALRYHQLPGELLESVVLKKSGEVLNPAPGDRAAVVFMTFDDKAHLLKNTGNLKYHLVVSHSFLGKEK
ncbi:Carbamoyl-phosphate synthase large chain [Dickeya dianthicola]|uniref:Carbamoyl-phosphate synthase small subunit n=1 Tax=Dickeya dianthicola TaxID=204039 RepID=A0AAP2D2C1_9GAMM|nr:carbamoyl-phosphate synthase small subunit [Dickeya dianthicola]AYC19582.1 Carbamoyl-phosphate synthase large chain [Dickeya dianthicola]MBI0437686.1 carbamoyl-phosphate synthase small subunit [Dickeya dianthicola]MBI0447888.1 carbamoyl-phosphate synthase small subunit [Dickeya dianthicola]MBI0452505.1 carbamoyl-phosphate synthase small subunit [Dickeya dianthicola]MBI0457107.1 carbamoyl-phosphate synthase small subunit [Dickeya dianthicola]